MVGDPEALLLAEPPSDPAGDELTSVSVALLVPVPMAQAMIKAVEEDVLLLGSLRHRAGEVEYRNTLPLAELGQPPIGIVEVVYFQPTLQFLPFLATGMNLDSIGEGHDGKGGMLAPALVPN
jgi:hypothetical protein